MIVLVGLFGVFKFVKLVVCLGHEKKKKGGLGAYVVCGNGDGMDVVLEGVLVIRDGASLTKLLHELLLL